MAAHKDTAIATAVPRTRGFTPWTHHDGYNGNVAIGVTTYRVLVVEPPISPVTLRSILEQTAVSKG